MRNPGVATIVLATLFVLGTAPLAAQRLPGGGERGRGGQAEASSPQNQPLPQSQVTISAEPVALFFAGCDADHDGRTTRAELAACTAASFAAIDTEKRGTLGYIEFSDWSLRWVGDRNALPSPYETDSDNDNRITPAELQAVLERIFNRLDRNHDGVLDRAEMLSLSGRFGGQGLDGGRRGRRSQQ